MLNKFFTKPLELEIGEQNYKFCSIADFEFAITGRTAIPSRKISEMVKFTTEQMKKEARTIKEVEKRFVSILSKSIEDPDSINRALREMDPVIFSQDHGWRDIISALNNREDKEYNPLRRIALVKYMQYLASRQEIIKYLYSEKKKLLQEGNGVENTEAGPLKDTLMLENTVFQPPESHGDKPAFERMPKGEAVTISLKPGEEVELILSKHECKISAGDNLVFTDQKGRIYNLEKGRTTIGRDAKSTIIMEPTLRDVSRLHLMVEKFDDQTVQLTDMSAHGTSIQANYLDHNTVQ